MLRFPILLACGLLSLGFFQAQTPITPEKALALAVDQAVMCKYASGKIADNQQGEPILESLKQEEKTASEKFSLKLVFKEGRHHLKEDEPTIMPDGHKARVIHFTPRPERERPKPSKGEDEYYNRLMNQLGGTVFIDQSTGGIMRIEGTLHGNVPYKVLRVKIFDLQMVKVTFVQKFDRGQWIPDKVDATVKFWRLTGLYMNVHDRYTARFDCK